MSQPRKVLCNRSGCQGIIAHIHGKNMVELKRGKTLIDVVGKDYTLVASCPYKDCSNRQPIIVKEGEISEQNLIIKPLEKDVEKQEENE